jgi:hypothetical protein
MKMRTSLESLPIFHMLRNALGRHSLGTEISAILNYINQSKFQQHFIRRLQQSGLQVIFVPVALERRRLASFRFLEGLEPESEICNHAINTFSQSIHDALT